MGLSSFNRARRSRLEVDKFEAERFKKDNEARWKAHHALDTDKRKTERDLEKSRKLETEAVELIGEKVREGIRLGEEGGIIDLPLRQDHAAEIAGRSLENNQEPKDPVARVEERIASGSATEQLVEHTQVDQPGPPAELVDAAHLEQVPEADREAEASRLQSERDASEAARAQVDEQRAIRTAAEQAAAAQAAQAEQEAGLPEAGEGAGVEGAPATKKRRR